MKRSYLFYVPLLGTILSGCVGHMPQTADEFRTELPGAFLGEVEKFDVNRSFTDVGIPTGRSSYLVFVFESSGMFSADSTTTFNTLIRPREGYRYKAQVSYKEDIYNEVDPGSKKSRELDTRGMSACRPV